MSRTHPRPRPTPAGSLRRLAGRSARRLVADERGGEAMEYVLIAGLIIVVTIAAVAAFGAKVVSRWTTVIDSSL